MVKYTWYNNPVPKDLRVTQVYGIAFSKDSKILLRIEDGKYELTGGKPEANELYEDTLKREYLEELNVELEECYYLGYLLVEDNKKRYAQVRMIAKIKNIGKNHIDPATNKIYGRELADTFKVKELLNYHGDAGNNMLDAAIKFAKEKYNL